MRCVALLVLLLLSLSSSAAQALTVDEIIKLKRAGVSDSTIELLIRRGGDARSAGVWRQDGWIVHSTESRLTETTRGEYFFNTYPVEVYPQFFGGRRFRSDRR